jgi:MbtH protein
MEAIIMNRDEQEDTTIYKVVVNHEEQYSIWPADRENPLGWKDVGKSGLKAECLAYIKEVWTDMRPLSLRKKMEEDARKAASPPPPIPSSGGGDARNS